MIWGNAWLVKKYISNSGGAGQRQLTKKMFLYTIASIKVDRIRCSTSPSPVCITEGEIGACRITRLSIHSNNFRKHVFIQPKGGLKNAKNKV